LASPVEIHNIFRLDEFIAADLMNQAGEINMISTSSCFVSLSGEEIKHVARSGPMAAVRVPEMITRQFWPHNDAGSARRAKSSGHSKEP
jgi:hypothetical protein